MSTAVTPMLAPAIARFEAMLHEAEQLATVETGQAKAFNQGRASAVAAILDELALVSPVVLHRGPKVAPGPRDRQRPRTRTRCSVAPRGSRPAWRSVRR